MNLMIWVAVVILSMESLISGNGAALVAGLTLAVIGIVMEARRA